MNLNILRAITLIFLLFAINVNGEPVQTKPQDFIKLQSYFNSAKRALEFNDYRNAFNYCQRIIDIDWQYENIISDYLTAAIKSGAVKEAETALLKIYSSYRNNKINSPTEPAIIIMQTLAVFYLSTGRDQLSEEFISGINKSGLNESDKITIISDIYNRGGRIETALSVLTGGRQKIKNERAFAWQFYQLYFRKNDYFQAGFELINHFSNLLKDKNAVPDKESIQTAEAELTKVIELSSSDETKKIIQLLEKKSTERAYYNKLLSAVYFNLKEYDKAFDYYKKAPADNLDGNQNYLVFARELQDENELDFAIAYYENFFSSSSNIPTNQPDFFNYLRLVFSSANTQRGLAMLEAPTLPELVNPVLLDLFKAEIYFYQIKQPGVAEKICAKYIKGKDLPALLAKKIQRDLAVYHNDYRLAVSLNDEIKNSDLTRYNLELQQESRFADCILALLQNNSESFQAKAAEIIKLRKGSDSDNDILKILQYSRLNTNQSDLTALISSYAAFKIHRQPVSVLDSLKATAANGLLSEVEKQILFDYLNTTNPADAVWLVTDMVKKAEILESLAEMIYKSAQKTSKDQTKIQPNEANLHYLIKNYPKSIYLEPARKLLRKLSSKRAGGI